MIDASERPTEEPSVSTLTERVARLDHARTCVVACAEAAIADARRRDPIGEISDPFLAALEQAVLNLYEARG